MKNLIEILICLHTNGILSLQINPQSIGITTNGSNVKLLSFGNSVKLNGPIDLYYESWFNRARFDVFTAPELYFNNAFLLKSSWGADIWSLGILLAILFQSDYSYKYKEIIKSFDKLERKIYSNDKIFNKGLYYDTLQISSIENPFIKAFIASMIIDDALMRPIIFSIADNFNKLIEYYSLDEEYYINYTDENVRSFLEVFDAPLLELININKNNVKSP